MELITNFIDFFIHLDKHLNLIIQNYGVWTYLLLWLIIFCETGLVIFPILPGDSLLFAAGAFAATGSFKIGVLLVILTVAAFTGNIVNYSIGRLVGPKIFQKEKTKLFKKEYLDRAHQFYEKHGAITIVITRFIPIIRTFAPFVAGISHMTYPKFIIYNIIGGVSWVASFTLAGFYFGNIPSVKNNFTLVIFAIIIISLVPTIIELIRRRRKKQAPDQNSQP
jgi:membrane-associated protein